MDHCLFFYDVNTTRKESLITVHEETTNLNIGNCLAFRAPLLIVFSLDFGDGSISAILMYPCTLRFSKLIRLELKQKS